MATAASPLSPGAEALVALELAHRAALGARGELTRGHLFFELDRLGFERALARLELDGFEVVRKPTRRYVYPEAEWVVDAELARGRVGVYLRRRA